jgi:hypothetical protein
VSFGFHIHGSYGTGIHRREDKKRTLPATFPMLRLAVPPASCGESDNHSRHPGMAYDIEQTVLATDLWLVLLCIYKAFATNWARTKVKRSFTIEKKASEPIHLMSGSAREAGETQPLRISLTLGLKQTV